MTDKITQWIISVPPIYPVQGSLFSPNGFFWPSLVYFAFSVVYQSVFLLFFPLASLPSSSHMHGEGENCLTYSDLPAGEWEVFYDTLFLCNREATDLPYYLHLLISLFNLEMYAHILGKNSFQESKQNV